MEEKCLKPLVWKRQAMVVGLSVIIACIVGALFCTVKAINAFHSDRGSNDFWRYIVGIAVSILGIVVFTVLWTSLASYL